MFLIENTTLGCTTEIDRSIGVRRRRPQRHSIRSNCVHSQYRLLLLLQCNLNAVLSVSSEKKFYHQLHTIENRSSSIDFEMNQIYPPLPLPPLPPTLLSGRHATTSFGPLSQGKRSQAQVMKMRNQLWKYNFVIVNLLSLGLVGQLFFFLVASLFPACGVCVCLSFTQHWPLSTLANQKLNSAAVVVFPAANYKPQRQAVTRSDNAITFNGFRAECS